MTTLQKFNFEQNEVQTVLINEELYFIGKEISTILGYSNSRKALSDHVDPEDKLVLTSQIVTLENIPNRGLIGINESGLYSLVIGSKLPTAKKFKRWVTKEVLPSIRKHGAYATPQTIESIIANPDFGIQLLSNLKEEKEKNQLLKDTLEEQKPQVVFAKAVEVSQNSVGVKILATILKQNGIDIGQNRMFQWLRDNKYLSSRPGNSWNMPTQKSMDLGLFELKPNPYFHKNGEADTRYTPLVTGKGQIYFVNKFNEVFQIA
ncbi:phage antirepressor KilAC domain-containing protein [Carnobacterium maltaromaticum]|uniref:phage antirepressor KilAC domain-containing protein n=1 Tax=Carnobacterium maltaromaticum TaxID=2751 RepID=UPI0039BEC2E6